MPPAEPRQLGWRFWAAVTVGAVVVDLAARLPPWNNVAASMAIAAMAAALLASGRRIVALTGGADRVLDSVGPWSRSVAGRSSGRRC